MQPAPDDDASGAVFEPLARRWHRDLLPAAALAAVLGVWALLLYRLGALRHDRFETFGFDLGIYGQAAWLVANGESPFMTVRGLDVWGHHATFIFYLLAPGSWLGGGPKWLLVAQLVAQTSAGVAIYLLVRDVLGRPHRWIGVCGAMVFALNPTQQWMVWEFFHPESFAVGPLLLAWWALRTARWRWFAGFAIVTVSCKEDLALAIAMMGLGHAIAERRSSQAVRIGAGTAFAAVGWYLLVTKAIIPARNPAGAFYEQQFFTDFGTSIGSVLLDVVRDPMHFLRFVTEQQSNPVTPTPTAHLEWYRMMLLPTLGLGLLKPRVVAIALPAIGVAMLADVGHNWVRDYRYHYSAVVTAILVLAAVEVVIDAHRRVNERADWLRFAPAMLMGGLLISSLIASRLWGALPSLTVVLLAIGAAVVALVALAIRLPLYVTTTTALALAAVVAGLAQDTAPTVVVVAVGLVVVAVATTFSVSDEWVRLGVVVVAVLGAIGGVVLGGVLEGNGPADRGTGYWPFGADETMFDVVVGVDPDAAPVAAAKRRAVQAIPDDASVSAVYNVVPHLTERRFVYEFPNPWMPTNWGVQNENQADPATVEYLVIDRRLLGSASTDPRAAAQTAVLAHLLTNEFETLSDDGTVVLARRIAPPMCVADAAGALNQLVNAQYYETIDPPSTDEVCPVT